MPFSVAVAVKSIVFALLSSLVMVPSTVTVLPQSLHVNEAVALEYVLSHDQVGSLTFS